MENNPVVFASAASNCKVTVLIMQSVFEIRSLVHVNSILAILGGEAKLIFNHIMLLNP